MQSLWYYSLSGVAQIAGIVMYYTNQIDAETWHFIIISGLLFLAIGSITEK
jgi:hypothetical protein